MKYVDENAWAALLEGIRSGVLLNQDGTARAHAVAALPQLTDMVLPPPQLELDLSTLKDKIESISSSLENANALELGLANLSYFFHLAAKSWEDAYNRVSQIASRESAAKFLMKLPGRVLLVALQTGLSALTAGGAALVYNLIKAPFAASMEEQWYKDGVDDSSKEGIKGILDAMVGAVPIPVSPASTDGMINPTTVFNNYEGMLRKAAVELWTARSKDIELKKSGELEAKLVASISKVTGDGGFAKFILDPITSENIDAKWETIAWTLAMVMRRAAWTQYCRSNWGNFTWDYTIAVKAIEPFKTIAQTEDDPRKWPSKVWDSVHGWPQYWSTICGDFCGIEHMPDHPLNEHKTAAEKTAIAELQLRMAWISMAAVHCCQIQNRFSSHLRATKFDMQEFPLPSTPATNPKAWQLLMGTAWSDDFKPYRSKKHASCQIAGLRFSDKPSIAYGVPTGKKGRHETPCSAAISLQAAPGYAGRIFGVIIQRSDIVSTESVSLNWAILKVSAADAQTVTHQRSSDGSYKFSTNKVVNGNAVSQVIKPAASETIWTTAFKTGATQTKSLPFRTDLGLYAFWLSSTVQNLELSQDVWYVWVVAPPK